MSEQVLVGLGLIALALAFMARSQWPLGPARFAPWAVGVALLAALAVGPRLGLTSARTADFAPSAGASSRDGLVLAPVDDAALEAATKRARAELPDFLAAVRAPGDRVGLAFKYGVEVPGADTQEFLWFDHVFLRNGRLHGRLANDAEWVDLPYGAPIDVAPADIVDWKYVRNGTLHGGHSLRVFRDRMTPEERAAFDADLGVRIP